MFKGDVAVFVGGGAPQQRYVQGKALVKQVLLAAQLYQFHQVFRGCLVHLAALDAGVYKSAEADLGQ